MLPKSVDIAKVISDDATGDEEELEELPEASAKKFMFFTVKFLILNTRIYSKKKYVFLFRNFNLILIHKIFRRHLKVEKNDSIVYNF